MANVNVMVDGVITSVDGAEHEAKEAAYIAALPQETFDIKVKEIGEDFDTTLKTIENGYTAKERESWFLQRQEADSYTADNTVSVPLLSGMATARGTTVAILAAKIVANGIAWTTFYSNALGVKQKREDELEAIDLTLPTAIDLINGV